jgi:hypothetical protein
MQIANFRMCRVKRNVVAAYRQTGRPDLVLIYFAFPSHPSDPAPRTWPTWNVPELIGMRM